MRPGGGNPVHKGDEVTCLVCDGSGRTSEKDLRGVPYPRLCPGCGGKGKQVVRG